MNRPRVLAGVVAVVLVVGSLGVPADAHVRNGDVLSDRKGTIFAFDRTTGERVWRQVVTDHPAYFRLLYAAKGKLIAIERRCDRGGPASLVGFDQSTGEEVWRSKLNVSYENEIRAGPRDFGPGTASVVVRTFHVGANSVEPDPLQAFDPDDGELLWQADVPQTITAGGGKDVIVLYNWNTATPPLRIFGVERRTGQTLWTYTVQGDAFGIQDVQVGSDTVQLVTEPLSGQAVSEGVVLDLATGVELWRARLNYDARLGTLQLGGLTGTVNVAFAPRPEIRISAVDARTRAPLWERNDLSLNAVFIDGMPDRMLGFPGGSVVAIDTRTGRDVWSREIAATGPDSEFSALGRPTRAGKGMIIFESSKGIHAVDAATGETLWVTKVNAHGYMPIFGKYVFISEDCVVS